MCPPAHPPDPRRTAEGDTLRVWRTEPFVMVETGPRWHPPSMTAVELATKSAPQERTLSVSLA